MSHELEEVLGEIDEGCVASPYLLWGEEFLVRKGAEELVARFLPEGAQALNFSVLDGASAREVAQDLATLPLFPGRKVVLVRDPEFLAPKKGRVDVLGKAREAWRAGRRKEGARRVLALVAKAGWTAEDIDPGRQRAPSANQWRQELGVELSDLDLSFLKEIAQFCREEQLTTPDSDGSPLLDLLSKGVPAGQILLIAATDVDPKNPLVKAIRDQGRLIERKVAARLRDLDVAEMVAQTLRPFKKRLGSGAEDLLKDRCGANMRLLQSELEKLALYAEGPVIQAADVNLLVGRSREEEFLELSNALHQRDLAAAVRYVENALGQGSQPLQLLGAIASILRTLLAHHDRLSRIGRGRPPRGFDDFKARVYPQIEEESAADEQRPPHPWAAFLGMQAAARYQRADLFDGLVACADADLALKSSGSGKLVIERLLWKLCPPAR